MQDIGQTVLFARRQPSFDAFLTDVGEAFFVCKQNTRDMDKNKRKESYEPPKMESLEIMVEQAILQMSGWGDDSDDSEFGDPFPTYFRW